MDRFEFQDYIERNFDNIIEKYKRLLIAELQDVTIEDLANRLDDLRFIETANKSLYQVKSVYLTDIGIEPTEQDKIPS